ncbi:hypothetical protein HYPSUDRAFT_59400 [Hypholoma sublateritium FD-334 SS-4]|uniref:Uncharacterized protein n=1 Tax=Hypholoma sublateritium (strain FD-334 SS-4) TaxID=945553 RepID=A0A0D2P169_HYPSF|nr:hypothetical protein HYPSUDRAFT_59400 [Hypholoma sublateritium FD-334 SS-4]
MDQTALRDRQPAGRMLEEEREMGGGAYEAGIICSHRLTAETSGNSGTHVCRHIVDEDACSVGEVARTNWGTSEVDELSMRCRLKGLEGSLGEVSAVEQDTRVSDIDSSAGEVLCFPQFSMSWICIGAPVFVEIADPQHAGRFRRVVAQVIDHIVVPVQSGAETVTSCSNALQRRSYLVRLGNQETITVHPSRIASLHAPHNCHKCPLTPGFNLY